jgi:hypothetical protein
MGIADKRPDLPDKFIFNRPVEPPAGDPVGVNHLLQAIGGREVPVMTDYIFSELAEMLFGCHKW